MSEGHAQQGVTRDPDDQGLDKTGQDRSGLHEPGLDKAELARRAGVPEFIVDVVVAAGLVTPLGEAGQERFAADSVDMLIAAKTLVDSGIPMEELTALALRHATHTEEMVDDAIELFKRHIDRRDTRPATSAGGRGLSVRGDALHRADGTSTVESTNRAADPDGTDADETAIGDGSEGGTDGTDGTGGSDAAGTGDKSAGRAEMIELMQKLAPVASSLVGSHFERILRSRVMARLGDEPARTAAGIVVEAHRLGRRIDPVDVYLGSQDRHRMLWVRPDEGFALVALGAVEVIEPHGETRFSAAASARVALAARVRRDGPAEAPPPVLTGGFSFVSRLPGAARSAPGQDVASAQDQVPGADEDAVCSVEDGLAADAGPTSGDSLDAGGRPDWEGYPDARWVLPEITLIDRSDGTWLLAARRCPRRSDVDAADASAAGRLAARIESLSALAPDRPSEARRDPAPEAERRAETSEAAERDGNSSDGHSADGAEADGQMADGAEADGASAADDAAYTALVAEALAAIGDGSLHKVVVARCCERGPVDLATVLPMLAVRYPSCALISVGVGERHFVAASPEQLVALDGGDVRTVALAGTAGRSADPEADRRLGAELLESAKARAEHRFVVDDVSERLADLGLVGETPETPQLLRLARVQHLQTPITARIERRKGPSDMDVLRVAGVLHPTPAVAGTPTEAALEWIARHEGFDRGWYAAPVGWCDLEGNGELRVALRSALIDSDRVLLFAGAGIVADSDPASELAETEVKLRAMLDAMDAADAAPRGHAAQAGDQTAADDANTTGDTPQWPGDLQPLTAEDQR